jgi:hypothetical protein
MFGNVTMNDSQPPAWQWINDRLKAIEAQAKDRADKQDRSLKELRDEFEAYREKQIDRERSWYYAMGKAMMTGLSLAGAIIWVGYQMLKESLGLGGPKP